MNDAYLDFLRGKIKMAAQGGFEISEEDVNPLLKPHQKAVVLWAVRGGQRAIFAAFGLGKSFMQLEILRLILVHGGGRALLCAPLGVRQEFFRDRLTLETGEHPHITDEQREELRRWQAADPSRLPPPLKFIRSIQEAESTGLYITNYETVRDGKIDPKEFRVASLDEASVLRSYGSKTYQEFLPLFNGVEFKFVATATPSPNRYKELIHYAGFLNIMDTGQALTRFFQRDSTQANNLTLYPHKEQEFWLWVHSWAVFLQRPSDLGFSDEGYTLPPFEVIYHEVPTNHAGAGADRDGQMQLLRNTAIGLSAAAAEKRESLDSRVAKMLEIVKASPKDHFIVWHDLEDERRAVEHALPTAVSVFGSQDLEKREQAIIDFSDGKFQYLAAKPVIAGSGCNFQRHCHKAIFLGIGYKFNDFIQAIHRIQRFLQAFPVEIHIVYSEAEREVLKALQAKWKNHNTMVDKMSEIIREHGLNTLSMQDILSRTIGVERIEVKGERFRVANNDAVLESRAMEENSLDLIVTSIPFANQYEYTPSYNDFGHTESNAQFWAQMDFLTPELYRTLKPGRVACIHVKDRIQFGNVTGLGFPTCSNFHEETSLHFQKHGFAKMGMITVVTDVVRENAQTYRLGWTENSKDGSKMGVGCPEYILIFRKPQSDRTRGYADTPITKDKEKYTRARWQVDAHAFWRSSGERLPTAEDWADLGPEQLTKAFTAFSLESTYSYDFHVKIGEDLERRGRLPSGFMTLAPGSHHPDVWHDVNRMLTLNGDQTRKGLENHMCPLQFDIVDRLIERYSMPDEKVHDPFGGIMTVPYRAVKLGRLGSASELNTQYFFDGIPYLKAAESQIGMPSLFDLMDEAV